MMYSPDYWIDKLQLKKYPEGVRYREIYRSAEVIDRFTRQ